MEMFACRSFPYIMCAGSTKIVITVILITIKFPYVFQIFYPLIVMWFTQHILSTIFFNMFNNLINFKIDKVYKKKHKWRETITVFIFLTILQKEMFTVLTAGKEYQVNIRNVPQEDTKLPWKSGIADISSNTVYDLLLPFV